MELQGISAKTKHRFFFTLLVTFSILRICDKIIFCFLGWKTSRSTSLVLEFFNSVGVGKQQEYDDKTGSWWKRLKSFWCKDLTQDYMKEGVDPARPTWDCHTQTYYKCARKTKSNTLKILHVALKNLYSSWIHTYPDTYRND